MDYVTCGKNYIRFSAGLRPFAEKHMRLYATRDSSCLALRNEMGGPLTVETSHTHSMDMQIRSSSLAQMLRLWQSGKQRIPAVYAESPDAVFLARQEETPNGDLPEGEFLRLYVPIPAEELRRQSMTLTSQGLLFPKKFMVRCELTQKKTPLSSTSGTMARWSAWRRRRGSSTRIPQSSTLPGGIGRTSPSIAGR